MLNSLIRPEKRKEWWRGLNRAANFFKHADKDPDELLGRVEPVVSELAMSLNCLLFEDLEGRWTPEMNISMTWHTCICPQYYIEVMYSEAEHPLLLKMRSLPRSQQLAAARWMLEQATARRPKTMF
jgi:hypothetical protein